MSNDNIITNRELQKELSDMLKSIKQTGEAGQAKIYFIGARTLLTSVKMDIETAKWTGVGPYKRTKQFLETETI